MNAIVPSTVLVVQTFAHVRMGVYDKQYVCVHYRLCVQYRTCVWVPSHVLKLPQKCATAQVLGNVDLYAIRNQQPAAYDVSKCSGPLLSLGRREHQRRQVENPLVG